jgi:signal transduction histidine kinase/DNA-binding response OmpR family regulator/ligand-binding sensor domain-containing protein
MKLELRRKQVNYNQVSKDQDGTIWTNGIPFSAWDGIQNFPVFTSDISLGHGASFLRDGNERLWVGVANLQLLQVYNTTNWRKDQPLDAEKSKIFEEKGVTPVVMRKDRSGLLWLGTNGYGLRKYTFESEKFNHFAKGVSIRKIMPFKNGELYIRGWSGVKKLDKNGQDISTAFDNQLFKSQDFFVARDQSIWILHRKQLSYYLHKIEEIENYNPITQERKKYPVNLNIQYEQLEPIMEDRQGNLWVCCLNGAFIILNPHTGAVKECTINTNAADPMLQNAPITALYEDARGVVWMGTPKGFVKIIYDPSHHTNPTITWFKSNPSDKNSLSFDHVSCFLDDPLDKNILWIATKGGGLNRFNKSNSQFTHITTKEGLCNDVVYGILPDETGHIWGSTNNGIFCLLSDRNSAKNGWEFRHFTSASGLQASEFNTGAFTKMPDGRLAFGGVNGLNIFDPKEILVDTFSPNIFITKLLVGNKEVSPNDDFRILKQAIQHTQSIFLDHTQDIFTLEFSSLDFRAPDQNKYRYQMDGLDKEWIESGHRHSVSYSHLPAGKYTFKVQGSNSLGIWSDKTAVLHIAILPPWWRTWWAMLAYLLMGVLGIRAIFKYRLQQNNMETQLLFEQNEAKRIKELDTAKTRLYTNITHEFRTPLTIILGMAQQAKNNPSENQDNALDMIIRSGKNLLNLVNELLDLSKVEAGKMELNLVQGDVIQFVRYIVESFNSMAESQGKQLHYLSSLDVFHTKYDAEKLRQIISNLLSNALKFSLEKGNVYISISSQSIANAPSLQHFIIKIKDTGIGIPEGDIIHIFDRFYQADNTHTRHAEGTGIGLALTKELTLLLNGSIDVKSPPVGAKQGTEFTVILPLPYLAKTFEKSSEEGLNNLSNPALSLPSLKSPNLLKQSPHTSKSELILLVEDNSDVVAYTAGCLPDYRLAVAKDGREGFEIACDLVPDLIITDVMMPYLDGYEMTRLLRNDERSSHIPIIMLTAKADIESKLEGIEHGADAYLEKPFYKEELLLRIKKLLEQRKLLQKVYSKIAGLHRPASAEDQLETIGSQTATALEETPAKENEFVKKVRQAIESNLSDEYFGVEELSKKIYLSQSQLHRKLSAVTGHSPNQFIRLIRTQKACELLKTTELPISQIAAACGFSDSSYFGKVFKQEMGVTPMEWRNGR